MEANLIRNEAAALGVDPAQYSAMAYLGLDSAGAEEFAREREVAGMPSGPVVTGENAEPDMPSQGQETAATPDLNLGTAATRQSVEPPFDPSDPDALQNALDTHCVDRGD